MKVTLNNIVSGMFFLSALFFVYAFFRLGAVGFISDSEIWVVNIAKNIREEWFHSWVFTRPLFYSLLSLAVAPLNEPIAIFQAAKTYGLINASLILIFTALIAREISSPKWKLLGSSAAICFLLTNTGFLNQGYRIRSDLLACTLLLISFYLTIKFRPKHWLFRIPLWLTPLAATPKSILSILPFLSYPQSNRIRFACGISIVFLMGLTVLVYPQLVHYIGDSFSALTPQSSYLSRSTFFYFERLIEKNPIFVFLILFRTLTFFLRYQFQLYKDQAPLQLFFSVFVLLSILIAALSPEKNPFYLATMLPLAAIFVALFFEDLHFLIQYSVKEKSKAVFQKLALTCALITCLAVSTSGVRAWSGFLEDNNKLELYRSIRFLDGYLAKFPLATHYDIVGLIPNKTKIRKFAGPNDAAGNGFALQELWKTLPNLIFYVRKGTLLEPGLSKLLNEHYLAMGGGIFARWDYFGGWQKLNKKNWEKLEAQIDQSLGGVGISKDSAFHVLMKNPKGKVVIERLTKTQLKKRLQNPASTQIAGISPFETVEQQVPLILTVGFDWDQ
jgi:hypothetical protein